MGDARRRATHADSAAGGRAVAAAWFVPMTLQHGIGRCWPAWGHASSTSRRTAVDGPGGGVNPPNLAFTIGALGLVVAATAGAGIS